MESVEIVIEPEGVDPDKYKRIGEERTRTLEFEPGKLYVKEIILGTYGGKCSRDDRYQVIIQIMQTYRHEVRTVSAKPAADNISIHILHRKMQ